MVRTTSEFISSALLAWDCKNQRLHLLRVDIEREVRQGFLLAASPSSHRFSACIESGSLGNVEIKVSAYGFRGSAQQQTDNFVEQPGMPP